jgi:hypothetical protein
LESQRRPRKPKMEEAIDVEKARKREEWEFKSLFERMEQNMEDIRILMRHHVSVMLLRRVKGWRKKS